MVFLPLVGLLLAACAPWVASTPPEAARPTERPVVTASPRPTPAAASVVGGGNRDLTLRGEPAAAWREIRRHAPPDMLVIRPEWVPDGLSPDVTYRFGLLPPQWWYDVVYRNDEDTVFIAFIRGGINAGGEGFGQEEITVRERHTLMVTIDRPAWIIVSWEERGHSYHIQARGITREDMRRIVASLVEVR